MGLLAGTVLKIRDEIAPALKEIAGDGSVTQEVIDCLLDHLDSHEAQRMRVALHYRIDDYVSGAKYAEQIGKSAIAVRKRAANGDFESARNIDGIGWIISTLEPWPEDKRVTHGRYRDRRNWAREE